jgi:hypothetical protein
MSVIINLMPDGFICSEGNRSWDNVVPMVPVTEIKKFIREKIPTMEFGSHKGLRSRRGCGPKVEKMITDWIQ